MTSTRTILVACLALLAAVTATAAEGEPSLMDPSSLNEQAPETFRAKFETSKGSFVVEVQREWAPIGSDRFYNLVKHGYYNDNRFFRVLPGFVAQFGLNGNPVLSEAWRGARIPDDPVAQSNLRGSLTFATSGANSRTTQLFINLANNKRLDGMGFAPFGKVVEGMEVVSKLFGGYGEGAPRGRGPSQGLIMQQGNPYLESKFPKLDYIITAEIVE